MSRVFHVIGMEAHVDEATDSKGSISAFFSPSASSFPLHCLVPQLGAIGVLSVERRLDERSFDLGTRLLKSVIGSWAVTAVLFRHSALGSVCFLPVRRVLFFTK